MLETSYNKALSVIEAMADGTPAALACELVGISWATLWTGKKKHPELETAYQAARAAIAHRLLNEVVSIADTVADANRARVMVDARKFAIGKYSPEEFSDRVDLNVSGTIDLSAALQAAKLRSRPSCDLENAIDAEVTEPQALLTSRPTDTLSVSTPDQAGADAIADIFEP